MTTVEHDVYIAALQVNEIFADKTYQRILDVPRARKMCASWDRRLAGILEVSDRGEDASPRYAVLDGQHRWAAAGYLQNPPSLVANVHSGLTIADEAALFDRLNRQRKQISTWDHWKARRAASDPLVVAVESTVTAAGLRLTDQTGAQGAIWCIGTLEKIAQSAAGMELLAATLTILTGAWGDQRAAFEAPMVHGMAMVLSTFADRINGDRLIESLGELPPKRVRVSASTMRDSGISGSLAKLSAVAILNQYNQKSGKRLNWPSNWKGVLPKARADRPGPELRDFQSKSATPTTTSTAPAAAADGAKTTPTSGANSLTEIGNPRDNSITVPAELPPHHPETDAHAEAVEQMADRPDHEIAQHLGITERAVRRIRADLGLERPA